MITIDGCSFVNCCHCELEKVWRVTENKGGKTVAKGGSAGSSAGSSIDSDETEYTAKEWAMINNMINESSLRDLVAEL